jgi:hypothetical protein
MRAPQIFALIAFIVGISSIVVKSVERSHEAKSAAKSAQK